MAMGAKSRLGGAFSVIVSHSNGYKPTKEEIERIRQEMEARERSRWEQAVPLPGKRQDIICLPLALSVGEIDENGIGPKREAALTRLMAMFPAMAEKAARETIQSARAAMDALTQKVKAGEPIRIWSSNNPDEACGLYWLMEKLSGLGIENADITLVMLPEFEERPDGTQVRYNAWGEVEPHQWGRMAGYGIKLSQNSVQAMAGHWMGLRKEDAPLRAVLNGRLVSAPEFLYDSFILRELAAEDSEMMEANVIGNVLGKYQLGIGDAWVAWRIERFIHDGLLQPVTQPDQDDPIYHRILRKCNQVRK